MITVHFPSDYPHVPPLLFEDQGRIKREGDWHVNNDGSLCLGPEVSELRKYMGRAHLLDWLDRSALPFLANHLYRERTGDYLNGEFSHGVEGIWEYYMDEWKCSPGEVRRRLQFLSGVKKPGRQDQCHCGSGLPWRKCHWQSDMRDGTITQAYANDLNRLGRSTAPGPSPPPSPTGSRPRDPVVSIA
ncbi:MAG: SEC-C domain-containing protein [Flavobacteriales bacterium]|nr:SEC-C domain-containing protein [Flavobacteriales bacterium]